MALVTKLMEFKDKESMERFIMLYKDLFKPWSESVICQMDYVADKRYFKDTEYGRFLTTTRGHHDDDVALLARNGIKMVNSNMIKIHIESEDFKKIQGNFRKEKVRRNYYKYVLD